MSLISTDLGFISVEAESTYGTDPASSPTYLLPTEEPEVTPARQVVERSRVQPYAGNPQHAVVDDRVSVSFQVPLSPVAYGASELPAVDPLMVGSGHSSTTSGGSGSNPREVTYTPASHAHGSFTLVVYRPDKDSTTNYTKITVTGVRGNISISYGMDSEILLDFEGEGTYAEWTSLADESSNEPSFPVYSSDPWITQGQSFSYGSVDTSISNFSFSSNWGMRAAESVTGSAKAKEIFLHRDNTGSRPGGSFDPLATSVGSTDDDLDTHRNATAHALALDVVRGTEEWHFSAPKVQLEDVSWSTDDAFYRFDDSYVCNMNSGDDDYSIKWKTSQ